MDRFPSPRHSWASLPYQFVVALTVNGSAQTGVGVRSQKLWEELDVNSRVDLPLINGGALCTDNGLRHLVPC